jgi:hypothetical protein
MITKESAIKIGSSYIGELIVSEAYKFYNFTFQH